MFGKLLSTVTKVASVPLDVAEIGLDVATGGNGDRKELRDALGLPSDIRDKICEHIEDIDI
jgi:hypothetical protein